MIKKLIFSFLFLFISTVGTISQTQTWVQTYGTNAIASEMVSDGTATQEQNEADKLKSVQTELENAKIRMGEFVADGLVKLEDSLGLTNKKTADLVVGISTFGGGLVQILPAIGGLTVALKSAGIEAGTLKTILTSLGTIGVIAITIAIAYEITKTVVDLENSNSADIVKNQNLLKDAREEAIRRLKEGDENTPRQKNIYGD